MANIPTSKVGDQLEMLYSKVDCLSDCGDVLRLVRSVCLTQNVLRFSYHMTPIFEEPNSIRTSVIAGGFAADWLRLYGDQSFRQRDPIPTRTMRAGELLPWSVAMTLETNTTENEAFFEAMRGHGLVHGVGVPLFGPRGRNAYSSFDFGKPIGQVSPSAIGIVRGLAQAAHQRIAVLIDAENEPPILSGRELDVLNWLVRGKSIAAIGIILNLSAETIKTYIKRIYSKLGTSDRVSTTIKAIRLGLVNL